MDIMGHAQDLASQIIANQKIDIETHKVKQVEATGGQAEFNFDKLVRVTDDILELYKQTDYFPWTSFDIVNMGPSPVYFCVNQWISPEAPMEVGQSVTVDYKQKDTIAKVYLKCDKDKYSTVHLFIKK